MAKADSPILIAVDGSKESEDAFDYFRDLLYRPGDRIVILSCEESKPNLAGRSHHVLSEGLVQSAEVWGNVIAKEKERQDQIANTFTTKLRDSKIPGEFRRVLGKPGEVIVEQAAKVNAKLIVMGSRGLGNIRKALLGSVSDYVLKHASAPVAVYRIDLKL